MRLWLLIQTIEQKAVTWWNFVLLSFILFNIVSSVIGQQGRSYYTHRYIILVDITWLQPGNPTSSCISTKPLLSSNTIFRNKKINFEILNAKIQYKNSLCTTQPYNNKQIYQRILVNNKFRAKLIVRLDTQISA